ncbi:hypothetical protein OG455_28130 [Kitasatospora sp. NBC_01287]|uniref:hypothetical protein n=1 Tax=Kitasatospora sp. NBC_01287 TaxID=2903573 RepID=UPI00224FAC96|nr:hypothetical protein [Kitasatospora sp. NBC_01287]MCX4749330.1 hypothetical protein [Kitasatospora sp. NBC_01287]
MVRGRKSVSLVGLGPHARRIYYPMLARAAAAGEVDIPLLIELEDQRQTVESYLATHSVQPTRIVYVPTAERDSESLPQTALQALEEARRDGLWGMIVATEPRAHRVYSLWALENAVHVLLDKPVTARSLVDDPASGSLGLVDDFYDLLDASERTGARCLVQTQRRAHLGYELIHSYLREFLGAYGVPVTYLDLYHADGMWNMPDEFFSRENHSYKYGYGKLMHSGYHFFDLMTWLLGVNDSLRATAPDRFEFSTRSHTPADFLRQVGPDQYRRFFGEQGASLTRFDPDALRQLSRFGETDLHLLGQFRRGEAAMTTVSMNLLQTSFSRRAWMELPADTYKSNGRVRHERMTIQVGHLLNIQVHSYQSYESGKHADSDAGLGHYDHFDVYFFRNSAVVGGKPFDRLEVGEALARGSAPDSGYLGHNEAARSELFNDFLNADSGRAGLASHELPVKLAASTYWNMLVAGPGRSTSIDLNAKRTGWLTVDGADVDTSGGSR